eukprot:3534195-Prymnesium_polylepis.1
MFGLNGPDAVVGIQLGYCAADIISKCGVGFLIYNVRSAAARPTRHSVISPSSTELSPPLALALFPEAPSSSPPLSMPSPRVVRCAGSKAPRNDSCLLYTSDAADDM